MEEGVCTGARWAEDWYDAGVVSGFGRRAGCLHGAVGLSFCDDPDGVDDAGDVAEDGKEDVEPEGAADADGEEDAEGREDYGENYADEVCHSGALWADWAGWGNQPNWLYCDHTCGHNHGMKML